MGIYIQGLKPVSFQPEFSSPASFKEDLSKVFMQMIYMVAFNNLLGETGGMANNYASSVGRAQLFNQEPKIILLGNRKTKKSKKAPPKNKQPKAKEVKSTIRDVQGYIGKVANDYNVAKKQSQRAGESGSNEEQAKAKDALTNAKVRAKTLEHFKNKKGKYNARKAASVSDRLLGNMETIKEASSKIDKLEKTESIPKKWWQFNSKKKGNNDSQIGQAASDLTVAYHDLKETVRKNNLEGSNIERILSDSIPATAKRYNTNIENLIQS